MEEEGNLSPAERVFNTAELATICLAHAASYRVVGCAASVCSTLARVARNEGSVWRAVALRWPKVGHAALLDEGGEGACVEIYEWWVRACGRRLLRDGVVCGGCGRLACDRCRPAHPSSATARLSHSAGGDAAACGTSRVCEICEEVAIGNHSPRWCARCLQHCIMCGIRACTGHVHKDGRCVTCAEDEWSTFGAFVWERGEAS